VKRYQKRPIYWLFSSPKGSFNALIYMHRYRPDTVSVVLNEYLRDFRSKLEAHKRHLEQVSISATATPREKTAALKEIGKLEKSIAELTAYEGEVLYPLATQQVAIDLDDGVKVNYNKLGKALRKIVGVSGVTIFILTLWLKEFEDRYAINAECLWPDSGNCQLPLRQ
jgi:hypothetical protein